MSRTHGNNIKKHSLFMSKIIEESKNTDGKKLMEMSIIFIKNVVNELSKSVIRDVDNLKSIIKKPVAVKESEPELIDKNSSKHNFSTGLSSSMESKSSLNSNVILKNSINSSHYNLMKKKNLKLKKEFEVLILEDSNYKVYDMNEINNHEVINTISNNQFQIDSMSLKFLQNKSKTYSHSMVN
jgi:hypothetical protein